MVRNKGLQRYRHKSFRLEKERLQAFRVLCAPSALGLTKSHMVTRPISTNIVTAQ